jgi:hypothetical protein
VAAVPDDVGFMTAAGGFKKYILVCAMGGLLLD